MERTYVVFVSTEEVDDDDYSAVTDWAWDNIAHPQVLLLTEDEVYFLQYETPILDIINEEIKGMLQVTENDWIISEAHKRRIEKRMACYLAESPNDKAVLLASKILEVLRTSIRTGRNMYFNF